MSTRARIRDLSDRLLYAREDAARETVRGQLHLELQSARNVEWHTAGAGLRPRDVEHRAHGGGDLTSRERV